MQKYSIIIALILTITIQALSQVVQFKVPIRIQSGSKIDTLWVGVNGDGPGGQIEDNTYGPDLGSKGRKGQLRELLYPPDAPSVEYNAKFIDLPNRSSMCGTGMRPRDIRGFTSVAQIDSFAIRVYGNKVAEGPLKLSWPKNLNEYGKEWQLLKRQGPKYAVVVKDMASTTSYTDPNDAYVAQLDFLLIKSGVVIKKGLNKSK